MLKSLSWTITLTLHFPLIIVQDLENWKFTAVALTHSLNLFLPLFLFLYINLGRIVYLVLDSFIPLPFSCVMLYILLVLTSSSTIVFLNFYFQPWIYPILQMNKSISLVNFSTWMTQNHIKLKMSKTEIITLAQVTKKHYEFRTFMYLGGKKEIEMIFIWTLKGRIFSVKNLR